MRTAKTRQRFADFLLGSALALAAGIVVTAFYLRLPSAYAQVVGVALAGDMTGPANVRLGGVLSYRVTVRNEGTVSLASYQLEDIVPTGLTFQPSGSTTGCAPSGGSVICTAGTLDPGETDTFRLRFVLTENNECTCECDLIFNRVIVNGSLNLGPFTTQIICEPAKADISVLKSGPASVVRGSDATYTLTVTNNSGQEANAVILRDKLPTGMSFVSATGADCTVGASREMVCDIPSIAPYTSLPITVLLRADLPAAGKKCTDRTVRNTARVKAGSKDPVSSNNSSTVTTAILCPRADLRITKSGPVSVTRGTSVVFTLDIDNNGPAEARDVVIKDKLPSVFTFVSATGANCTAIGRDIRCDIPVLPVGRQSISIMVTSAVIDGKCTAKRFKNTATVSAGVFDQNKADNTSTIEGNLLCTPATIADLSIAKTGPSTATAIRGGSFYYTITVKNLGPGTATNVIVEDQAPEGLVFLTAFDTVCSNPGSLVRCNIGTLSKGETKRFRLLFSAPSIERCNEVRIQNTAVVRSDQTDPKLRNNTTKRIVTKLKCPKNRITIKKTDDRTTIAACGTLTYKITLKNQNNVPAHEIAVVDTFPNYLRPVRVSDAGRIFDQTVVWERVSLPPHATKVLSFVADVRSTVPQKTVITNYVTAGGKRASDKTTVKGVCTSSSSYSSSSRSRILDTVLPPTGAETDFFAPKTDAKQFIVKTGQIRPREEGTAGPGVGTYTAIAVVILTFSIAAGLFLKSRH